MNNKRVEPIGRSMKDLDDILSDDGGGIFEAAAKVAFKQRPAAGPSLEDLLKRQAAGPQRTDVNKAIQGDAKKLDRIKKLEAVLYDPAATDGEKENARALIKKFRG